MAARKSGLGKGLDSLIPNKMEEVRKEEDPKTGKNASRTSKDAGKKAVKEENIDENGENIQTITIDLIEPNREQPRRQFDPDTLNDLADSIRIHGVLQPLLVSDKGDYYEIVAGERRWRAAKIAGLKEIPVIIKKLSEKEIVEISLIENIQREDLNPIEEAKAYERLLTEFHLKQEEIAERVSKSRSAITNSLRLLRLHPAVQDMLIRAELHAGHARALLAVEDSERQLELAQKVVLENLSVRETEKLVKSVSEKPKERRQPAKDPVMDAIYRDIAENMRQILGTRVEIHPKKDKGKIEIEYYSQDELNRILELFQSIEPE